MNLIVLNYIIDHPVDIILGIANICLIIGLMSIYWKSYKHYRTRFSLGLVLFAAFLLIHNLLYVITFMTYQNFWGGLEHNIMFLVNLSEFIGLVILLKVTLS
jgi:hypothetical protein